MDDRGKKKIDMKLVHEWIEKLNEGKLSPMAKKPAKSLKKKKKQHKKSDHKHEYIPVIIYDKQNKFAAVDYGFVCKHCGRIDDLHFGWGQYLDKIKQFEEEHPDFIEIELPHNWHWFKDKYLPIGE